MAGISDLSATAIGDNLQASRYPNVPVSFATRKKHRSAVLILILLALIVPLLAIGVLSLEGPRVRGEALTNLAAIGRLKAEQIEAWLGDHRGDAELIMSSERYIDDAQLWFERHDSGAQARIAQRNATLKRIHRYQDVQLLDARTPAEALPPARQTGFAAALASGKVQTSNLYRDETGEVWLDFVAPLIKRTPAGSKAVGAVVLRTQASTYLFPFIQTWPTASPSAETLLLRREGDNVLFLNELRHRKGAPLNYRRPLDSPDLPAAMAIRDKRIRTLEGRDYRGIPVLASVSPVQGTDWLLVAKIDMDEVERPLYQLVTWVSIVALAALLVVVVTLRRLWLQQARNHRLELIARTGERDRLLNLFYNLPFMGMAIIDPHDQRWLHVNDQMCEILGYSREELLASTTWPQLTHPDDLAANMANYQRMLAGEIDGYQLEKRCLRKGGDSIDVALSVKCVRRGDGGVEYVVKTVRDISDRRRLDEARTEQQRSANLLYAIANTSTDAIFAKDREGNYLFYNRAAAQDVGKRGEEVIGHDDSALFPAELADRIRQRDQEVMTGGKTITFEETLATTEGERIFLTTKGPMLDGDGKVIGLYGISRDITERKFEEERIKRSQAQLQLFIEHAPISIAMFDQDMNYLAHSRRWLEDYGLGRDTLVGLNHYRHHSDMPEEWRAVHMRALAGETVKNDADHWYLNGSERWTRWAVLPWKDTQGAIGGIIISVEDITERKRAEEALRYQLDLNRSITEKATDSIFINDAEGRVTALNAEAERAFGYRADELVGRVLHEIIHHHHRDGRPFPMEECPLCHVYKTGEMIRDHEAIVFRKDGSKMYVTGSNAALESNGRLLGAALILHDITELKQVEQALREREQDLTRAQTVGRIGSWRLDVLRNALTWSAENHRIFGIPEGTPLTYETFLTCVHPEDRARVDQAWQAGLGGAPYDIEHRLLVNGQVKWVREKAEMEFGPDGNLLGGFGITQDISDIKAVEQALRDSEERFQLASEIGRSGAWDWEVPSGGIVWSRGHFEILGYQVDEVQPSYQAWADRVHTEDLARIEAEIQRSMRERIDYVVEFRVVWPDGSIHWMSSRGRYQYDQDGTCQRMLGVMADITSLKQAELALREADQRKDEFLAMLAHELRNPLAPIRNAAHVLGRLELGEPRLRWAQDIIERQVAHLTHLVDELLDISRIVRGKIALKKVPVELDDLVRQAREAVQPIMAAKGHRFEVRMPEARVVLEGDLVRLVQVLQNLLNNAAKYTPDGGRIELLGHLGASEIEIVVRDNGMGISADLLPSVFDLFRQGERTLDRSQGGLGLGLTLVRQLVELHGGQVTASSAGPGQGAIFSVRLPLAEGSGQTPAPAHANGGQSAATVREPLRVLVVEDDPVVCESMVVFLELEGYQVRSAGAAEAALDLLTEFRPRVALIDIGLPGQDGYALAKRIRQREDGAGLKLLAVSGYGQEEAVRRSLQAGFDQHLVKPVDPDMLCAILAEIRRTEAMEQGK
jgi:PAS domain S-box-containing protein